MLIKKDYEFIEHLSHPVGLAALFHNVTSNNNQKVPVHAAKDPQKQKETALMIAIKEHNCAINCRFSAVSQVDSSYEQAE